MGLSISDITGECHPNAHHHQISHITFTSSYLEYQCFFRISFFHQGLWFKMGNQKNGRCGAGNGRCHFGCLWKKQRSRLKTNLRRLSPQYPHRMLLLPLSLVIYWHWPPRLHTGYTKFCTRYTLPSQTTWEGKKGPHTRVYQVMKNGRPNTSSHALPAPFPLLYIPIS